jgi:sialate O-acetylesterase
MANFKVAAVFSSNMVLQRQKNIRVFGEGVDGSQVNIRFMDDTFTAAVKDGRWMVILPPRSAGTGYTMTVTCGNEEKKFDNIAIGEVWLAGGQSNMEYELQNCKGGQEMLQNDKNPNVRFYYTQKNAYMDEEFYKMEENSGWQEFGEETAKNWSAVGYIYGKNIAAELGVTVGIIGCNWGGTSASCWMSEESLREDKDLYSYIEEYEKAIEGKSEEEQIREYKEYESYHADWEKRSAEQNKINSDLSFQELQEICGVCQWPGPKCCMNPFRPAGLYHTMLQRVLPYTLRGFIYYQGESDDHKPAMYQKLLSRMIRQWREDSEDLTLPFLMVQLPMHRYKYDPDWKNWCLIREAQMNTFQTVKNTGIAVILDCGEFNEIHPKDKTPVGERLALQALYQVYQRISEKEAFGPLYQSYIYKDGGMELSFLHAEKGFIIKGEVSGFEVAGDDMVFVPAKAEFRDNRIYVSSPEIKKPAAARYCWTNYGDVSVFGNNGLPLAPFRTHRK